MFIFMIFIFRHGVSKEEYNLLRKRLRDLKRRHSEFRNTVGIGENLLELSANASNLSVIPGSKPMFNNTTGK